MFFQETFNSEVRPVTDSPSAYAINLVLGFGVLLIVPTSIAVIGIIDIAAGSPCVFPSENLISIPQIINNLVEKSDESNMYLTKCRKRTMSL